jgi:Domain of unknown function (DUF4179)
MRQDMAAEREESQDEMALRATLHMHASEIIHSDKAWESVAPRLAASGAVVSQRRKAGLFAGVSRGLLVAASLAIVVALAGAGVGAAYWGGLFGGPKAQLIGDERLYTTIGQSQSHDGLTVTIDQAYADPGNTYIAVTFTMPDSQASHYSNVIANSVTITDGAGNEARGLNYVCEPLWHDALFHRDGVQHCLMDLSAFQPPAGTAPLNLNVEIGELWLFRTADHQRDILTGPWSFTFSLPFHQQNLGPGGPYAEPGTTTPSTPGTKKP